MGDCYTDPVTSMAKTGKCRIGYLLKAIEQAELPVPESIEILQSSPHRGGLGMDLVSPPNRYRLHATIKWQSPQAGPVAIGSGRYKGLGFCKAYRELS